MDSEPRVDVGIGEAGSFEVLQGGLERQGLEELVAAAWCAQVTRLRRECPHETCGWGRWGSS